LNSLLGENGIQYGCIVAAACACGSACPMVLTPWWGDVERFSNR